MNRSRLTVVVAVAALVVAVAAVVSYALRPGPAESSRVMRIGISPFQDTLVPLVGEKKGWYREEGVETKFSILGWTETMEALSAGHVDVVISNISSVVGVHQRNPEIVYWYAVNPFDNGFALMIRPNGPLKSLDQMMAGGISDRREAIRQVAAQLKGKTVITTGNTDMEQGVVAAARRGDLDFRRDVRIIDLNPEEGLAAFLRGEGDAYIGGIPQRTRASSEGMVEMLTGGDLGPPPINGFVTTKKFAREHEEDLLKILHVWFRIVRHIDANMDDGAKIVVDTLNAQSGGNFTIADFRKFWNHYEHYPASPIEAQRLILDPNGANYWKARWDDCNEYFFTVKKVIAKPVNPDDAFLMEGAQRAYVAKYGKD